MALGFRQTISVSSEAWQRPSVAWCLETSATEARISEVHSEMLGLDGFRPGGHEGSYLKGRTLMSDEARGVAFGVCSQIGASGGRGSYLGIVDLQ